jgi:hypothetical protein
MPYVNAYITNGGYGGVMLGIRYRLPLVVAGVHEGKNEICARVGYFRLGINLRTETPAKEQIRTSVDKVIADPNYKRHVNDLAAEFSKYDPASRCATHIGRLLRLPVHKTVKTSIMKTFAFLTLLSLTFFSCKKDHNDQPNKTFKGPELQFQHGKAWTWYEEDGSGKPVNLAVTVDSLAMHSLDTSHAENPGHHHTNMISLVFPSQASKTPFRHFGLDWNPHGHEPEGIYGQPHFDFHFYMISEAERNEIPSFDDDPTKFQIYPERSYMPANYIYILGGVPQMGSHWVDTLASELHGNLFTQTFLMGSYDGKVIFYEPMITHQFILDHPKFQRSVPQPAKVAIDGWYPTSVRLESEHGAASIIAEKFVYRKKS